MTRAILRCRNSLDIHAFEFPAELVERGGRADVTAGPEQANGVAVLRTRDLKHDAGHAKARPARALLLQK